jgi:hypothetical protein
MAAEYLYILVPVGVSEQAPAGIFRGRGQAEKAAERLWKESDGYHTFEVHEMNVGVVYDSFSRGLYSWALGRKTDKPLPDIGFKAHTDLTEFS